MRFIHQGVTGSTNADARALVDAGERGPLWISAAAQTAGRGRRGREWVSRSGNLYASGLFAAFAEPIKNAQLSFCAALSIADVINAYAPDASVSLKWPNDVLVDGAKISGVLLETGQGSVEPFVIVGIGINLEHHPDTAPYPVTHLLAHMATDALAGPEPIYTGAEAVLALLAARFEYWRGLHAREGFAPIAKAWTARAHGLGEPITVGDKRGILHGLGLNGELQLRDKAGTLRSISAGDVFFGES